MFIKNAKNIALKSFSMWCYYLIAAVFAVVEGRFYLFEIDTNPVIVFGLILFLVLIASFGRILDQGIESGSKKSRKTVKLIWVLLVSSVVVSLWAAREPSPVTIIQAQTFVQKVMVEPLDIPQVISPLPARSSDADFLDVAFPLIAEFEGKRNHAYLDVVGVATICYGSTRGVKLGQYKTDFLCRKLLEHEILEYRDGMLQGMTFSTIETRLPLRRSVAFTSLAINIGIHATKKSTATRRLNAGDIAGSCQALTWFNKAGGRVWAGLQVRRAKEKTFCLA